MLIYHEMIDEDWDGGDRAMADVIDPNRAAFLCTYKGKSIYGRTYTTRYAFVFDDDRSRADMADYLDYFSDQDTGRLVSIRAIRPNEELTVDILFDYRPNYLPVLKEAC